MPSPMLVVGSVAFDTLHFSHGHHPRVLGGAATYGSIAAAHFTQVQLVGVVGKDFPDSAVQMLRSRNVDLAGLEVADGETFHWEGRYSEDLTSRETLRTDLNVFAEFSPKVPAAYRKTPYVMLGNLDPVQQMQVLEQIDKPQLTLMDTMNLWIDIRHTELVKLLERVDVFVLNDEEARQLSDQSNLIKAAHTLQSMGPSTVIIKKGEHGALLFEGDDIFGLPALPLSNVVDPTGAGDTFAGALLGSLAHQNETSGAALRRAVVYGSVLASFCVEGVSTQGLIDATPEGIAERVGQFERLTAF